MTREDILTKKIWDSFTESRPHTYTIIKDLINKAREGTLDKYLDNLLEEYYIKQQIKIKEMQEKLIKEKKDLESLSYFLKEKNKNGLQDMQKNT